MVAAQLGVATGHRVGLVDRVLEARRRRIGRIPQQRRLVGGDEQHLPGVQQRRVNHAVVGARPAARDRVREGRPAPEDRICEVRAQEVEKPAVELLELPEVTEPERVLALTEREDLLRDAARQHWDGAVPCPRGIVLMDRILLGVRRRHRPPHQVLGAGRLIEERQYPPVLGRRQPVGCLGLPRLRPLTVSMTSSLPLGRAASCRSRGAAGPPPWAGGAAVRR